MLFSRDTSGPRKTRTGFFLLTASLTVSILTAFPSSKQSSNENASLHKTPASSQPTTNKANPRENLKSNPRLAAATLSSFSPPVISITNPLPGSSFPAPGDITIDVEATDSDGIAKVDFYQGNTLLGTDDTFPYSFHWTGMAACTFRLIAKATDLLGATSTSAPVTVKVNGGSIGEPTPPNFKVAFFGDQGLGPLSVATLNLVLSEGAQALVIPGDLDYADDPAAWEAQLNSTVGPNFPVFTLAGDKDEQAWHGPAGYQKLIEARFNRLGIPWCGSCGVQQSFHYKGIFFVFTTPALDPLVDLGSNDSYVREQLAADHSVWSISSWHKNMHLMQAGDKSDEAGWEVYEESRTGGAIIANAHEQSYFRTHLLSSMMNQTVTSTANTMTLTKGDSFVFVSGLGGQSRQDQEVTGPWIARIYATTCLPGDPVCQSNAVEGALFGVFNVDGQQNKANFYFKDVNGRIVDSFTVISQVDMPSINSITPSEVGATGPGLTLTVNGSGFINQSVLHINGIARPTAYLNSTVLLAQLTAEDVQVAGVFPVKVVNAVTGGGVSNEVTFTVNEQPNQIPVLSDLSPASSAAGSSDMVLTVTGTDFVFHSIARWNGQDRPTTFVNDTKLTVLIPAADLITAGSFPITVFNPAPGGGLSNSVNFTVNSPGYEGDVAPRPNGNNNGILSISDWVQVGRFVSGLDIPSCSEFQRADVAPRDTLGGGTITISDWVQAGRYVSGLDPVVPAGGPSCAAPLGPQASRLRGGFPRDMSPANGLGGQDARGPRRLVQINDESFRQGKTGVITVTLEAQGNENALGFSLSFMPAQMSFVSATHGLDALDATLMVNSDQAAVGGLEISLALPPGQQFKNGSRELVALTFKLSLNSELPLIGFSDRATNLTVVDFNAAELAADFAPMISPDNETKDRNPIDEARFFVNQNYLDFLGRAPEPQGLDYWTNQISLCGMDRLCIQNKRVAVSAAFFMEPEYQRTGYAIHRFYKAAYGKPPTYIEFLNDHPKLVSKNARELTTAEFAKQFTMRSEFRSAYPDGLQADLFVTRLFDHAGIEPTASERREAIDALARGSKTRAQVLLELVESNHFKNREYNAGFVLIQYFGYLRRDPDQGGYDFWLSVLNNQQPGNYLGMVCSFITSDEYQRRFGPVATQSNADCAR